MSDAPDRAAQRAAHQPFFVASTLARYQQVQGIDEVQLATLLGCSSADLCHIRLCRMPRAEHVHEEVMTIALRFHVYAADLARILSS